ncbi:G patch domain-containing protein 11-like [Glandiceps talaboti]
MSSDEEDYMSDAFLLGCETVRPGLVPDRIAKQYKKEEEHRLKNLKSKTKPLQEQEKEHRDEGLNKELSSSNKGFALLQKMGYKKGMGLGKAESGRSEPVPVEIKTGRGGLGRDTALKRQQEFLAKHREDYQRKRIKQEEEDRGDFRQRMRNKFAERETESDLHKSRKACEQLDKTKGVEEPIEIWYWPIYKTAQDSDEDDESSDDDDDDDDDNDDDDDDEKDKEEVEEPGSDLTAAEKLEELTAYLRKNYFYCIWCGTAYDDEGDLHDNCPGDDAEVHR